MTEYALFFESGGPVFGEGYIASVRVRGRALSTCDEEDGEFEFSGVNPGSLLGFGRTLNEAYQDFVESLRCTLIDCASDAANCEDFRREVEDWRQPPSPPEPFPKVGKLVAVLRIDRDCAARFFRQKL